MRFCMEEAETRCSHITDEVEALMFDSRAKVGVEAELRRAM